MGRSRETDLLVWSLTLLSTLGDPMGLLKDAINEEELATTLIARASDTLVPALQRALQQALAEGLDGLKITIDITKKVPSP